jgi:hypothetical protein
MHHPNYQSSSTRALCARCHAATKD